MASTNLPEVACPLFRNRGTHGQYLAEGYLKVTSADTMAIHSKISAATGKTIASQKGLYIEEEALGTAIISGSIFGIDLETYVESGVTFSGDHIGIYVKTYSDIAGNQAISCARLEHNGASVANSFLCVQNQAGKMRYLLDSSTTADTWVNVTTAVAGNQYGFLKIKLGGYDRYIPLYDDTA